VTTEAQVPFGRLGRRMPEQQLDLLKLAAGGPTELRAGPPQIVGGDARNADRRRILLKELPDHLLAQASALHLVAADP
jgi:hypothetical protein